ncbi:MAG: transglutaminase [Cyclobacteriaceae bacterium]|nr:MAG: transglutaminase [Cyclobacteriaceae bacterium]
MDFLIEHYSSYAYSIPVYLEPHHLYFYPAARPHIKIVEFDLQISPEPQGYSARIDAENNIYHQCWFEDKIDTLTVTAISRISTKPTNPFHFIVDQNPVTNQKEALNLYAVTETELSDNLKLWLGNLHSDGNDTIDFLKNLVGEISNGWQHTIRYGDTLMEPNDCYQEKVGSCRDLSWMMMESLRHFEMPTRFVSGYCFNPELTGHELHAWVEVWINGAGWVGVDPSAGLFVTQDYIPISASYSPSNTLPVQGTYRGDAQSKLTTAVDISLLSD